MLPVTMTSAISFAVMGASRQAAAEVSSGEVKAVQISVGPSTGRPPSQKGRRPAQHSINVDERKAGASATAEAVICCSPSRVTRLS